MPDPSGSSSNQEGYYQHESAVKEAKWRALITEVSDAVIIVDELGLIQEINPATMRLFDYSSAELLGQNISMLMPDSDHSQHHGYIQNYLETGKKKIIGEGREILAKHRDGKTFPVFLSVNEARYDGVRLFVGIIHDLSDIKKKEEQLFQAQKHEAIAQLTAGIAHDFNNLLTVVQGNLEMLDPYVTDSNAHEILTEVLDAIDDGSHLVKQLLAFGRNQVLKPDVVDVNNLVRGTLRLLRRTISESIDIKDTLRRRLPPVNVDPVQLENALVNLVINARDALHEGGQIIIETGQVSAYDFTMLTHSDVLSKTYVRIAVNDNGAGMTADVLAHAFEPFFSTKKTGEGTGLGLSMVHGFVKQSGGEIRLESTLGIGTVVTLYLPCAEDAPDVLSGVIQKSTGRHAGNGETILLVEDDERVRLVNAKRLEAMGYGILMAQDGTQALDILAENLGVSLLFSDIIMPHGVLGHELADQARLIKPSLKVLLTTGYAEEQTAANIGPYKVLTKPYSADQLARHIAKVLNSPVSK